MSFAARFRGECMGCGGVIEPGEVITRQQGAGAYAHVVCPELDGLVLRPGEVVCSVCWTVHAGECA